MRRTDKIQGLTASSGLRTRYFPKSRIGHGLIMAAPWLNVMLLLFFFLLLNRNFILQPGTLIDLPRQPFVGGTRPELVAVVRCVQDIRPGRQQEIVYFRDQQFKTSKEDSLKRLKNALAERFRKNGEMSLVVYADRDVRAATLLGIMTSAREAGIRQINLASAEPLQSGGVP